jgi:hypothetical protein
MGNSKSKLKRALSTSSKNNHKQLSSSDLRNLDEEKELKLYHLSNTGDEDIDRQHSNYFFRKYIFQSNFSVPIEEKLIQGGCKVLDVG